LSKLTVLLVNVTHFMQVFR